MLALVGLALIPASATAAQKGVAYEFPVYSCINGPLTPAGTHVADVEYRDKGDGDRRLEDVQTMAIPDIANFQITETLDGKTFATFTESPTGTYPPIELKGADLPVATASSVIDAYLHLPAGGLLHIASSACPPAP